MQSGRTIDPLWEDDDLTVSQRAGSTPNLAVSFCSIGPRDGGPQGPEFIGMASMQGKDHVLFVADRKRSWYSTPGIQDRIKSVVLDYVLLHGIKRVHCIGASMGGFGALAFAERLGAKYAVAFAPQWSMDPADVAEMRWQKHRPNIRLPGLPKLDQELSGLVRNYVFFGAGALQDVPQCRKFIDSGLCDVRILGGMDHHLAASLNKLGLLLRMKAAMAENNSEALDRLLQPHVARRPRVNRVAPDLKGKDHDQV
jgi:pimeloyl-ACP methyl ester carboxylesterase